MTFALLALAGLAVGQGVRLVVKDSFPFGPIQAWLKATYEDTWLQLMLSCPWCLSGWLSLAATGALEWRGSVPVPPLAWFAVWRLAVASYWAVELLAKYGVEKKKEEDPPQDLPDLDFS